MAGAYQRHWLDYYPKLLVAEFLAREGDAMGEYIDELERHQPFKVGAGPQPESA